MKLKEFRTRFLGVDQSWLAARHEAGHAVIGWMRGEGLSVPGLVIDEQGNGRAMVRQAIVLPRSQVPLGSEKLFDDTLTMYMAGLLAGYSAEWVSLGGMPPVSHRPWLSEDYHAALSSASSYWQADYESPVVRRAFFLSQRKCNQLLRRPNVWEAVVVLSGRLERKRRVSADEADDLLDTLLGSNWLSTGQQVTASGGT